MLSLSPRKIHFLGVEKKNRKGVDDYEKVVTVSLVSCPYPSIPFLSPLIAGIGLLLLGMDDLRLFNRQDVANRDDGSSRG